MKYQPPAFLRRLVKFLEAVCDLQKCKLISVSAGNLRTDIPGIGSVERPGFKIAHLKGAEALGAKRSVNTIRFQNSERKIFQFLQIMQSNRTQYPPRLVAWIRSGSLGGLVASGVLSTCRWFPGWTDPSR